MVKGDKHGNPYQNTKWQGAMKMGEIREYCSLGSIIITDDDFFSFVY